MKWNIIFLYISISFSLRLDLTKTEDQNNYLEWFAPAVESHPTSLRPNGKSPDGEGYHGNIPTPVPGHTAKLGDTCADL